MKQNIWSKTLAALLVAASFLATNLKADDVQSLQKEAQQAVSDFLRADPGIKDFMTRSSGYAVFPNVGKGGLIVGGAHGKGVVYEKGMLVGEAKLTQASIGAQAGGQTFAEIIFFETPEALREFKGSNFEMSADVSAVAAAEGASKAARYQKGVAVFTLPKKGLMVQAAIGGQKFKFEPLK